MKFTTRFRPSDIGAAILLALVAMLFTSVVQAGECVEPEISYPLSLKWTAAEERTDGSDFGDDVNGGYKVYVKSKGYNCSKRITDKSTKSLVLNVKANEDYDLNITQWDTGGRESAYSPTVKKSTFIDIGKPSAPELAIKPIGSGFDYQFDFPAVTTYDNGEPLPDGAVSKYYLFEKLGDQFKWVRDVQPGDVPFILTLERGVHEYQMETEMVVSDVRVVSTRSNSVIVDVQESTISPPVPPMIIEVPEEGLTVTFIPK